MRDYNAHFGRQPSNAKDLHRALTAADDLDEILVWSGGRSGPSRAMTLYDRMQPLLDPTPLARGPVCKTVDMVNYPDGQFAMIQFEGISLPFTVFDKIQTMPSPQDQRTRCRHSGGDPD
jgi:hypothetical protein